MRRRFLIWLVLLLACVLGALYLWRSAPQRTRENTASAESPTPTTPATSAPSNPPPADEERLEYVKSASTAPMVGNQPVSTNGAAVNAARLKYRLSNTPKTVGELAQSDRAILLENALIDTSLPLGFAIPDSLRSKGDPGSYIVQSRRPLDDAFRARLRAAGVEIVSYIPNNAYLVRASAGVAQSLAAMPETQTVLPFEPYYKLKSSLLKSVIEKRPPMAGSQLTVVVFPDARADTIEALQTQGANIVAESPSPFGPQLTLEHVMDLSAVAVLPGVQLVQPASRRAPANDLSRATMGVARDSTEITNYLGLTGTNIMVAVVDSGVDWIHPDFFNRVIGLNLIDTDGHGTHVAGIIAGDGLSSPTVTEASGSTMPPGTNQFRGKAPSAKIFSLPIDAGLSDFELQQTTATNALISNNSWAYAENDYDIAAASYDAGTRDSVPGVTGSQGVLYVFAAGNGGNGAHNGLSGLPESIQTPATAKNVISVGSLEQLRNITNEVAKCETCNGGVCTTNAFWEAMTDSDNEVAASSARGNVGIGVEGAFGRFKPDVVAPGVMVISTRSLLWDTAAYYNPTNFHVIIRPPLVVPTNDINFDLAPVPCNAVRLILSATALEPFVPLPIYVRKDDLPTTADLLGINQVTLPTGTVPLTAGASYFWGVGNPTNVPVRYTSSAVTVTTNDNGNYFLVLSNMNENLGPLYRFESGTSMAAPAVSGMLALIQDYFSNTLHTIPSPALLKAMLINGARSANAVYNFQVKNPINYQGWGLANLTNSLPKGVTNGVAAQGKAAMLVYDQDPATALATAGRRTITVKVAPVAQSDPLRITLVWTDPPGNPAAGIKLVNNLDLVVTDLDNTNVFYGNDIPAGANFTFPSDTNAPPNLDFVNNVENVYISGPLATNGYSITIIGRGVNVNAVTAHTNDVAQDFALVISSGDGAITNALSIVTGPENTLASVLNLTVITNTFPTGPVGQRVTGGLLLNQRVGANSPLRGTTTMPVGDKTIWDTNGVITIGVTNQWHFYVLTNILDFTNAAFLTFTAPNLALPRMGVTSMDDPEEATRPEADIDLFVSTDPGLLALNPAVLAAADKSLGRGGTEVIAYTNATPQQVYYVGVHSEDQEAAEYGFFGGFSESPFDDADQNGNTLRGFPLPAIIPDGSAAIPGVTQVLAIATSPIAVRRVVVTNVITHEDFGDLVTTLDHNRKVAILHNHTFGNLNQTQTLIYEDNGENDIFGSQHTDGPGSLTEFIGEEGVGAWTHFLVDNALSHTGRVENLFIHLDRQFQSNNVTEFDIQPNSFVFNFVNVPPEATNLTIRVDNISGTPLPLILFVRRGALPTLTAYDYTQIIVPPGGQLVIDQNDVPPLQAGRYYIGIFNPNGIVQRVRLTITLGLDLGGVPTVDFTSPAPTPIKDDAVSTSTIFVPDNRIIARAEVGVAIEHARVSDLTLTLVSPAGKRVLLMENRGGPNTANLGSGEVITNFFGTQVAGVDLADTNNLFPVPTSGNLVIDYNFFGVPDTIDVYYEGVNILSPGLLFNSGTLSVQYGPGTATNITIIVNQNGGDPGTVWNYTPRVVSLDSSLFVFTENTNTARLPIKFAATPFTSTSPTPACPPPSEATGWTNWSTASGGNGHWYKAEVSDGLTTWDEAQQIATNACGYLATITSAQENAFVFSLINNGIFFNGVGGNGSGPAIGGRQPPGSPEPAGGWIWDTGEPWGYTNWAPPGPGYGQQPDDGGGFGEDRAEFFSGTQGVATNTWNDMPANADNLGGWVIERNPEPAASSNLLAFLPEEKLDVLIGDRAFGEWKLEIWDNRVGAPIGELVTWQLRFIFELVGPVPTPLPPFVPVTNTIPCGMTLFTVDVPPWASYATNIIVSSDGPLDVWFNQFAVPTAIAPPDTLLIAGGVTGSSATLSTNSTPPLIPGTRYFLGVSNANCASNITFVIQVDYDITTLTNAVPFTNAMPASTIPRYFAYDVSSNATAVSFQLTNLTGNLDLVARRGTPLPSLASFDYRSANAGTFDEDIIVFTNSTPVPLLAPGRWFLGVFNVGLTPANYTILATEYTGFVPPIITLTNAIPYTNNNSGAANPSADYYHFVVTTNAQRVQFEINNPSGDVNLVARKGLPLPDLGNYAYLSANPFTNDEFIVVLTNSAPVRLSPGNWYLTAVNVSGGPVSYSIKATEFGVSGQPIVIIDRRITGTGTNMSLCITWTSVPGIPYFVQGTPVLTGPWVAISPTIVATNFTTTYCIPLPTPYSFFRVGEGVAVGSGVVPPPLVRVSFVPAGVLLEWSGPATARYQVQWTPSITPPTWNSFTNVITSATGLFSFLDDGSQTGGLNPPRFYRVLVLP